MRGSDRAPGLGARMSGVLAKTYLDTPCVSMEIVHQYPRNTASYKLRS